MFDTMTKKRKSPAETARQMKKLVDEIVDYVNSDLVQRNAERLLPGFSRDNLFVKPEGWDKFFHRNGSNGNIHKNGPEKLLDLVIARSQEWLLSKQNPEAGFWSAPLLADVTLECDTLTLYAYMGWLQTKKDKVRRMANFILSKQLPDGGWNIYKNGPSEISATVKGYWALKIAGHSAESPCMAKARQRISELGGIHKINSYAKFYMALFGLYDWRGVPAIPTELMLFPKWFYFNIYEMSAWTRGIVIPLSIVWSVRQKKSLPPSAHLDELFEPGKPRWAPVGSPAPVDEGIFSWRKFFLMWDGFFKTMEGRGPHFLRTWSMRLARKWMISHFEDSDGLAAIFPPIVNAVMALECLGYPETHPYVKGQIKALEDYEIPRPEIDALQMQPCLSPIWDTALSVIALAESGLPRDHESLVAATRWLVDMEIRREGDWRVKNPSTLPGGWAFEFKNDFYPDIDDTAMVLLALRHVNLSDVHFSREREKSYLRGLNWMLSMQCSNGGWAAFDRDNTKTIFEKIPFADHNAMIDPPSADITARALELLGHVGYDKSYPCVREALEFLKKEQQPDGSWYGRWGVNYVYGTWQVLRGLAAIGEDMKSGYVLKSVRWLKSVQNEDGGWGERCDSYDDPARKGKAPSTPSQTAWGLMALLAAGLLDDPATEKALEYLLRTQNPDGSWDEEEFTGTGFPKVFYLEYTYYRNYFPLLALGTYRTQLHALHESHEHSWGRLAAS